MNPAHLRFKRLLVFLLVLTGPLVLFAQGPPSSEEMAQYSGVLAAAARGDAAQVEALMANGENPDVRDESGRTPLHVAAYGGHHEAMRVLVAAGADPNALDHARFDILTIAAMANDVHTLQVALGLGANPNHIVSRYEGTALIAAAHMGHVEVVRTLIRAGAPLDHVNNLGLTALIEAIVLGDGGPRHREIVKVLVEAGADVTLADPQGHTPLDLARSRGYQEMIVILQEAR
jgi:uncharacterized protein